MKLKHVAVMFVAVFFAYLFIDNPPMLRDADGRESIVPDKRKLHEFLLIDALVASLVIALQLGEPLARRKLRSPVAFSGVSEFEGESDDELEDLMPIDPLDDHLLITPDAASKPSPYFVFNSAAQYSQPVFHPIRRLIVVSVVMTLLAVGIFMFVENLEPTRVTRRHRNSVALDVEYA